MRSTPATKVANEDLPTLDILLVEVDPEYPSSTGVWRLPRRYRLVLDFALLVFCLHLQRNNLVGYFTENSSRCLFHLAKCYLMIVSLKLNLGHQKLSPTGMVSYPLLKLATSLSYTQTNPYSFRPVDTEV